MEGKGCGQDRKEDILCIPSNCMSEMGPYLEMSVAKPDIVSDGHLRWQKQNHKNMHMEY